VRDPRFSVMPRLNAIDVQLPLGSAKERAQTIVAKKIECRKQSRNNEESFFPPVAKWRFLEIVVVRHIFVYVRSFYAFRI
jgi:hypothetical protein